MGGLERGSRHPRPHVLLDSTRVLGVLLSRTMVHRRWVLSGSWGALRQCCSLPLWMGCGLLRCWLIRLCCVLLIAYRSRVLTWGGLAAFVSSESEHHPRNELASLEVHISGACTPLDASDSIVGVVDETVDGHEMGGGIGEQDIVAGRHLQGVVLRREVGRVVVRNKEGRVDGEGMGSFLEGFG